MLWFAEQRFAERFAAKAMVSKGDVTKVVSKVVSKKTMVSSRSALRL